MTYLLHFDFTKYIMIIEVWLREFLMEKNKSKRKNIIVAIVLCVALVVSGFGGFLIYKSLKGNYVAKPYLLSICKNRVTNAQYLPDINRIASKNSSISTYYSDESTRNKIDNLEKNITLENFNEVIETIGDIDNPFDREFTINDVKDEVYKVLNNSPYFDVWMYFTCEELSGSGRYYVSYNEKDEHLTIYRISGFQPYVYFGDTQQFLWNEDLGLATSSNPNYPIEQDEIYKIDYYYDEFDREVVECEIVSVLNYYKESRVTKYQYIKNVKDTSFTKYIINIAPEVTNSDYSAGGIDVDTDNPLGTERNFIQMDYTNKDDISLMFINQGFASKYNEVKNYSQIKFYRKLNDTVSLYNSAYSYGEMPSEFGEELFLFDNVWRGGTTSIFNYLVNEDDSYNDYYFGDIIGLAGNNDPNYKTRSGDIIKSLKRELYIQNETDSVYAKADNTYSKSPNDDDDLFYGIQIIPRFISQSLSSLAKNTGISLSTDNAPIIFNLDTADYSYETFIDQSLNIITQNIVEVSYIKNNYSSMVKGANKAIEVKPNVSAISDYIDLNNFESEVSLSDKTVTYNASADFEKTILLKNNGTYNLALVAKGNGNNFVMLNQGDDVVYKNKNMSASLEGTYNLDDFKTNIADDYVIGVGLVVKEGERYLLCSQVKPVSFNENSSFGLSKKVLNGFKSSYMVSFNDSNNLIISVKIKDIEPPKIEGETNITVSSNTKIVDLILKLKISDNDQISMAMLYFDDNICFNVLENVKAGEYKLVVFDKSNNKSEFTFVVALN